MENDRSKQENGQKQEKWMKPFSWSNIDTWWWMCNNGVSGSHPVHIYKLRWGHWNILKKQGGQ